MQKKINIRHKTNHINISSRNGLIYLSAIALVTITLLSSCKSKKDDEYLVIPAEKLYQDSTNLLDKQNYGKAAEGFGKIFLQHPGNKITSYAEIMQSYSLFKNGRYDEASDILETFIKLHPTHQDIAYAYYLLSLSQYMQIETVKLDQSKTALAKTSLEEVITRFPNTKYALAARLKIDLANDHLAGKEMEVGRYYLAKNNPLAAIPRFQNVVKDYQTTSHAQEALYRLTVAFKSLGLDDEAFKYASVLGHNYPHSKWYEYAYKLVTNQKLKQQK